MKKIIKVVTMILISLSAVAAFPDAALSKDKPYVSKKLHYAYITGYSDGSFRPYEFITRQEAAVIVCRLTDIASDNVYKKFKDVGADNWSYDAVERLYNMGIISGYDDGSFRPEENITRAEFAVMLYGFTKDNEPKKEFWDLKDHWAKEYIEKAAAGGWFAGYTDGSFHPDEYITRAEAVFFINYALDRFPEYETDLLEDKKTFTDVSRDDWFYMAVCEAANSHECYYRADESEIWSLVI